MHEMRNSYTVLVGKPEIKVSLRRHKCRWEDNIKWIYRKRLKACGLD
jgi:hypothetical protein